jgi:3',5'-cyclic AMP phosphodiesterase CpdA
MLSFESIYAKGGLSCQWFPVLGNHDYHGNAQAQLDYSKISRRWVLPARYHTFTQKVGEGVSARFILIDTSPFVEKYHKEAKKYGDLTQQDTARQWFWLDSVLAASTEQWKIVVGHHPVFSSSPKHGDQPELQRRLKPLLEKYGVNLYLCGHDHDLQHNQPEGSKVAYILSGAGSEIRPSSRNQHTKFVISAGGFVAISLQTTYGEAFFITADGKIPYRFKFEPQKAK